MDLVRSETNPDGRLVVVDERTDTPQTYRAVFGGGLGVKPTIRLEPVDESQGTSAIDGKEAIERFLGEYSSVAVALFGAWEKAINEGDAEVPGSTG